MKEKIVINNVMKYRDKKTNEQKCRIGYSFLEEKFRSNTAKLKGYTENSIFGDVSLFDKIPTELIRVTVDAVIEDRPSEYDPLRNRRVVTKIIYKDNVIDLV